MTAVELMDFYSVSVQCSRLHIANNAITNNVAVCIDARSIEAIPANYPWFAGLPCHLRCKWRGTFIATDYQQRSFEDHFEYEEHLHWGHGDRSHQGQGSARFAGHTILCALQGTIYRGIRRSGDGQWRNGEIPGIGLSYGNHHRCWCQQFHRNKVGRLRCQLKIYRHYSWGWFFLLIAVYQPMRSPTIWHVCTWRRPCRPMVRWRWKFRQIATTSFIRVTSTRMWPSAMDTTTSSVHCQQRCISVANFRSTNWRSNCVSKWLSRDSQRPSLSHWYV